MYIQTWYIIPLKMINYVIILAAWLVIKSFCKDVKRKHIRLSSDNAMTIAYLNNMWRYQE